MDGIAITCVILLALLTATQIASLFLWFRSGAKREEEARGIRTAVENTLARTLEIEAAAKNFGPAIERSTGATVQRLAEALTALEGLSRGLAELRSGVAALQTTLQTELRSGVAALHSELGTGFAGLQESATNGNAQRAKHTLVLSETHAIIGELRALASTTEATSRAVARSIETGSGRVDSIGAELARRLGQLESQLQSLRSELGEATKF